MLVCDAHPTLRNGVFLCHRGSRDACNLAYAILDAALPCSRALRRFECPADSEPSYKHSIVPRPGPDARPLPTSRAEIAQTPRAERNTIPLPQHFCGLVQFGSHRGHTATPHTFCQSPPRTSQAAAPGRRVETPGVALTPPPAARSKGGRAVRFSAAAGEDRQVPELTILPPAKRPKAREKREDRQDRQSFALTIFRELDDLAV